jgi:hypothetical protein
MRYDGSEPISKYTLYLTALETGFHVIDMLVGDTAAALTLDGGSGTLTGSGSQAIQSKAVAINANHNHLFLKNIFFLL